MNKRENLLSIFRRQGYETIPVHYGMCPSLKERFDAYCKEHELDFDIEPAYESLSWIEPAPYDRQAYWKYYDVDFKEGTYLDPMGGSARAWKRSCVPYDQDVSSDGAF